MNVLDNYFRALGEIKILLLSLLAIALMPIIPLFTVTYHFLAIAPAIIGFVHLVLLAITLSFREEKHKEHLDLKYE